jgi:hypothetical protein
VKGGDGMGRERVRWCVVCTAQARDRTRAAPHALTHTTNTSCLPQQGKEKRTHRAGRGASVGIARTRRTTQLRAVQREQTDAHRHRLLFPEPRETSGHARAEQGLRAERRREKGAEGLNCVHASPEAGDETPGVTGQVSAGRRRGALPSQQRGSALRRTRRTCARRHRWHHGYSLLRDC